MRDVSMPGTTKAVAPAATFDEDVELAGRIDVPVLITGSSRYHREQCARSIHGLRAGGQAPFVSIPARRLNVEHSLRTTASTVWDAADTSDAASVEPGGTLFVDDIAELTATGQEWLLALLDRRGSPRGTAAGSAVRVRIIAGGSSDVAHRCVTGEFSERLFYRLNIIHVELD